MLMNRGRNVVPCTACSVCVQVISLEGWVDIMYYVQDAHSFWDWVYFVALIVVSKDHFKSNSL